MYPKTQQTMTFLKKNWRPISLLNVIYELMSSVIANRLKSVLDKIISDDQKGFISGRYIGETFEQFMAYFMKPSNKIFLD